MKIRISKENPTSWDTFDIKYLIPVVPNGKCLDLGCGPGARQDIEKLGFSYIGIDLYSTSGAEIVGKAEELPFRGNSVDLVIAASSFEHFPDPWRAAEEVARVLKPGGSLVASISFLEPYHGRSHFHLTHLGARRMFEESGLAIDTIVPFEWTGPEAIAQALFLLAPARWLVGGITRVSLLLRRALIFFAIRRYAGTPKEERAREFLEEEKFRFTAGIKIKATKK